VSNPSAVGATLTVVSNPSGLRTMSDRLARSTLSTEKGALTTSSGFPGNGVAVVGPPLAAASGAVTAEVSAAAGAAALSGRARAVPRSAAIMVARFTGASVVNMSAG